MCVLGNADGGLNICPGGERDAYAMGFAMVQVPMVQVPIGTEEFSLDRETLAGGGGGGKSMR